MIEVSIEEYDNFKIWYLEYAKRNQNIRKLKVKSGIGYRLIIDKKTKGTVCNESHTSNGSKYRINPSWYEMYKNQS